MNVDNKSFESFIDDIISVTNDNKIDLFNKYKDDIRHYLIKPFFRILYIEFFPYVCLICMFFILLIIIIIFQLFVICYHT